jgi:hypothetical protein
MNTDIRRVYIAGPMRGIPQFNFPAFDSAADALRAQGFVVCNPADRDRAKHGDSVNDSPTGNLKDIEHTGFSLREAMADDLSWIASEADIVAVLPGWQNSAGARAEVALAHALGLEVALVEDLLGGRKTVIDAASGEVRMTSSTGGQKGSKPARYDLIPTRPLDYLARQYGKGAEKYDDNNWARGYKWSLSFAALQRHAWAFWSGEDIDPEIGLPHLAAVAFHAFSLMHFMSDPKYAQFDDRWRNE